MKSPAFPFYADDFMGGTCDLSQADVGAYIRLLCYQWGKGSIPQDMDKLERIAGGSVSQDVLEKFPNGINARLANEQQKQAAFREERSRSGKFGANKRWNGSANSSANGSAINQLMANTMANDSFPSPPPSPSPIPSPVSLSKEHMGAIAPKPRVCFEKPTIEQVRLAMTKAGLPESEADKFMNYYESNGWRVGRNPMRSWPHAVGNWKSNFETRRNNGRPVVRPVEGGAF